MIKNIIQSFQHIFNNYTSFELKEDYDVQEVIDGDGVIIIAVSNIEKLHPQLKDYKITIAISGQTYIDNDLEQTKIQKMFKETNAVLADITITDINVQGVVGYIFKQSNIIDTEETHGFTCEIDLFATQFEL